MMPPCGPYRTVDVLPHISAADVHDLLKMNRHVFWCEVAAALISLGLGQEVAAHPAAPGSSSPPDDVTLPDDEGPH
jgi:hypothetical protein